jgi:hypothetical protein
MRRVCTMEVDTTNKEVLVNVVAEPVPFERDGYQLFMNAIVTREDGQKMYIPHLLVATGLD